MQLPIDAKLLAAAFKVADCKTTYSEDCSIVVKLLSSAECGVENQSHLYCFTNNFISETLVIDYSKATQFPQPNSLAPEYEITVVSKPEATLSHTDEQKLQSLLECFGERITTTRIILPSDLDLSVALRVVSWFIPHSTSCISIEFQRPVTKDLMENSQKQNLDGAMIGICRSLFIVKFCKALLISHINDMSRRQCAEMAGEFLPLLSSLEILSMTHDDHYADSQTGINSDLRSAGKIWGDIIHLNSTVKLLRCSNGFEYWMPVYLLSGNVSTGWLNLLFVDFYPISQKASDDMIKVSDINKNKNKSEIRKTVTEIEIYLIVSLMILNTWVEEISFNELYLIERKAVFKALNDIFGSDFSSKLFKWNNTDNLNIVTRPGGKFKWKRIIDPICHTRPYSNRNIFHSVITIIYLISVEFNLFLELFANKF